MISKSYRNYLEHRKVRKAAVELKNRIRKFRKNVMRDDRTLSTGLNAIHNETDTFYITHWGDCGNHFTVRFRDSTKYINVYNMVYHNWTIIQLMDTTVPPELFKADKKELSLLEMTVAGDFIDYSYEVESNLNTCNIAMIMELIGTLSTCFSRLEAVAYCAIDAEKHVTKEAEKTVEIEPFLKF